MTRLLVLYQPPADPAAFDRYYAEIHIPIARKMPGLRAYTVSAGRPAVLAGDAAPHLVAELDFDNRAALEKALQSPEGQAAAADLAHFAQAGVTLLSYEVESA